MIEGLATPSYRSLIAELDRQRERRGWPIWRLEERAGLSEAHLSKLLRGERIATWSTLEFLIAAMFPTGCRLKLEPLKPVRIAPAIIPEHQMKILRAYNRHLLATIASSGGHARAESLTRERRQQIGRIAAQARWGHKRKLAPRAANGSSHNGQRAGSLSQFAPLD
jgi:transcriptional regulator with XRE-family HTH domain